MNSNKFTAIPMDEKPIDSQPRTFPAISPPGFVSPHPPSALDKLGFLEDFVQLNVHTSREFSEVEGKVYHAVVRDSSKEFVLKVDRKSRGRRYRQFIGGTSLNFMNGVGQIMFTCDQEVQPSSVTAGDFALGDIIIDSHTARTYRIVSKTGDPVIELKPFGSYWTKTACCCGCNACCMKLYRFLCNGTSIGAIIPEKKPGEGHVVTFGPDVNVKTKALMLSAAMMINENYYSSQWCFGKVGVHGRTWLQIYTCIAVTILVIVVYRVFFV